MAQNNYPNPLDNFRSHSYHFILTVSNSTEAVRKLIEEDSFMSTVNKAKLGDKLDLAGESAYLLLDTRRYSQFAVSSFETTQIYGTGSTANPSVPASLNKMRIIDSTGLTFFNYLMDTMRNKIQSTRASAFFTLAIVFTGHDDTQPALETHTVSTCFIPMILVDLAFDFSSIGSTYDLHFMEIEGNPGGGIPQMIELGDIQAISTEGRSNTVGDMIQALEDRLNIRSRRIFQKYTNDALTLANDAQKQNFQQAGKLVQYMITLPPDWKNFKLDTAGKSHNVEQVFLAKNAATIKSDNAALDKALAAAKQSQDQSKIDAAIKARASYKSFSYKTSVPDAINLILESSKQYLDGGSTANRIAGLGLTHKTVINITSNATTYVVHFDIYPFHMPKIQLDSNGKEQIVASSSTNRKISGTQIRNLLKYDYIFSGRNSHITDLKIQFSPHAAAPALDMDLNLGQSRSASTSAAGQKTDAMNAASVGLNKTNDFNPLMRPGEPVFSLPKTKDQQKNFTAQHTEEFSKEEAVEHLKAKQEYTSTLAVLHFLGSLQTEMTIRGNPNLLRKYADRTTRGGMAPHTLNMDASTLKGLTSTTVENFFADSAKTKITGGKDLYFTQYVKPRQDDAAKQHDDVLLDGPDISTSPVFVQINIKSPNTDYLGNASDGTQSFSNDFFFQGAYLVTYIIHTFENGTFKQMMNLIPYDIDGSFSSSTTASVTAPPTNTAPTQPNAKVVTKAPPTDGAGNVQLDNGFVLNPNF